MHRLASDYLERLSREAGTLPRGDRRELLDDIRAHLDEAAGPEQSDAEVLTVLDRLGDPAEIVAAHEAASTRAPRSGPGPQEWAAIILLLLGGFVFGVGWIAGVVLLWSSTAWRVREKVIGTLLIPGGLAAGFFAFAVLAVGAGSVCVSSSVPTVVPVGGRTVAPAPAAGAGHTVCSGGPSTAGSILITVLLAALVLTPIITSVYLARRAGAGRDRRAAIVTADAR